MTPFEVPHWTVLQALACGTYCDFTWDVGLEKVNLRAIQDLVRNRFQILNIATGFKKSDSIWRRRMMAKPGVMKNVVCPLADWNSHQVYDYLKARKIPLPAELSNHHNADGGIGLSTSALVYLYDHNRPDFDRLRQVFPYIDACIKRRDYYGVVA